MAFSVPGQETNFSTVQVSRNDGIGRSPERRLDVQLFDVGKTIEFVEAGTAYNSDGGWRG